MLEAKLFRSSGLAALAAGLVVVALPCASMAQSRSRGADGWSTRGNDASSRDDQRRGDVFSQRNDRGSEAGSDDQSRGGRDSGRSASPTWSSPQSNAPAPSVDAQFPGRSGRGDWSRSRDTSPGTSAERTMTLPVQAPVEVRQVPPPRAYSQNEASGSEQPGSSRRADGLNTHDDSQRGSSGWRSNRNAGRASAPEWSGPQTTAPPPQAESQFPGRSDRGNWSRGGNAAPGTYTQPSVTVPVPPPVGVHQAPPPRAHTHNPPQQTYRRWGRDWRENHRYNWDVYRTLNRNIFRLDRYYAPYRNYEYRRLGIGFFLDSLFYSDAYWIDDPWRYRLPDVYEPYRWVRYYDDVLLVDTYSGEVVDVIYDFFW